MMKKTKPVKDEQGIAFPMSMIVLTILVVLMAALAALATSEPRVGANHMASTQARALAESGLERVLWALSAGQQPTPPVGSIVLDASYNLPATMPAGVNGSYVSVSSIGGFVVTVANGAQANQKIVTAVGYVPNNTSPTAIKKITAVLTRLSPINPLCALCVGGETPAGNPANAQLGGTTTTNAQATANGTAPAGAFCPGVAPTAAVASTGTVTTNGSPHLFAPPGGSATLNNTSFPATMILTNSDITTLKAMALSMGPGHYYKGSVSWTSPPANGLIVVDTLDGTPLSPNTSSSNVPTLEISGNWAAGWNGWLVVAGNIYVHGNVQMNGLIYAQNNLTLHGTGNGAIQGAVIGTGRRDSSSTTIDDLDIGNAPISYNCPMVRNGAGYLSQNWRVAPGTYQEVSGS